MPDPIDPELLAGFSDEIDGYLPRMQEALRAYRQSPGEIGLLEEPYRYSHIIRGAAAMMGLEPLSDNAGHIEQALIAIRARTVPHDQAMIDFLVVSIERIQSWTRESTADDFDHAAHFADVAEFWGAMLEQYPAIADAADDASRMDIDLGEMPAFDMGSFGDLPAPDFADLPEPTPGPILVAVEGVPDDDMYAGIDGGEEVSEELAEVFAMEAEDHFRIISESLPLLRSDPRNRDLLQLIRRSAHTLKGAAGMVGFEPITRLSHRAEDLLDLLYEGVPAEPVDIDRVKTSTSAPFAAALKAEVVRRWPGRLRHVVPGIERWGRGSQGPAKADRNRPCRCDDRDPGELLLHPHRAVRIVDVRQGEGAQTCGQGADARCAAGVPQGDAQGL